MTSNPAFGWRYGELEDKNFEIHGRSLLVLVLILLAILLFTLFFLYVRWACRTISSGNTQYQTATPAASRSQMQSAGLDAATIKSLPVLIHQTDDQSASADEFQCSICLANLVNGEKVKVMPSCSHAFHPECVDRWLQAHSSCPLCRASLLGGGEPAMKAEAMV
ncbi:hypothetical protein J5N97_002249 [Dioscorea zingiberensis]|uniref:RING-type E3 ubiquitin transferase n=1 Tax=Dioscorea zingiberensis TaxID=325984 RepID=A0A9D5D2H7_9LILI|nr:hypothetical protein J5N97_002249 [Dioscorea zingiberensis]